MYLSTVSPSKLKVWKSWKLLLKDIHWMKMYILNFKVNYSFDLLFLRKPQRWVLICLPLAMRKHYHDIDTIKDPSLKSYCALFPFHCVLFISLILNLSDEEIYKTWLLYTFKSELHFLTPMYTKWYALQDQIISFCKRYSLKHDYVLLNFSTIYTRNSTGMCLYIITPFMPWK